MTPAFRTVLQLQSRHLTADRPALFCSRTAATAAFAILACLTFGTPPAQADTPVIVTQDGEDAVVSTSIDSVSSYFKSLNQRKIDDARAMLPAGLQLPKDMPVEMPVDAWSKMQVKGLAADPTNPNQTSELGAALNLSPNLRLGVATTENDSASQHQVINQASLASRVRIDKWFLIPQAALVNQHTSALDETGAHATETTRLDLAPQIRRSFKLEEEGTTIEPFVNYKTSLGLDAQSTDATETSIPAETVGVGILLSQPDEFKLEATTDVEGLADDRDERNVNSRVKLTVPLD